MSPWVWATGAAIVAIFELHAPGYYLIWLAMGAALTAGLASITSLSLNSQLEAFAVASSLSCSLGFFAYRYFALFQDSESTMNQRGQDMVGAKGVVCIAIANGTGKVRLGDSVWLAEGPDLDIGTPVIVRNVRNTIVVVGEIDSA
jgi:membrane protein implicated in regulation of membrane protease activity